MIPIVVHELSPEKGPLVGFALVAHESIIGYESAAVTDGQDKLAVPLRFYRGNLNMIRSELHKMIDDAIDALL